MVRAPSPLACGGMTDILRLPMDTVPGVPVLPGVPLLAGRFGVRDTFVEEERKRSGVLEGVKRSLGWDLGSRCDGALTVLGDAVARMSFDAGGFDPRLARRTDRTLSFSLSALDFLPVMLGLRLGAKFSG